MNGPAVIGIVVTISALLTTAWLLLENIGVDRAARRDLARLERHQQARRRLSQPRSLP